MPKIIICEADSLILADLHEIAASLADSSDLICCMSFDDAFRAVAEVDELAAFLVRENAGRVIASGITTTVADRGGLVIWLGGRFLDIPSEWRCVPWPFTSEAVLTELSRALALADPAGTGSAPPSSSSGAQSLGG